LARARARDTLLLASGEIGCAEVAPLVEAGSAEELQCPRMRGSAGDAGDVERDLNVLQRVERLQKVERLEDEADGLAPEVGELPCIRSSPPPQSYFPTGGIRAFPDGALLVPGDHGQEETMIGEVRAEPGSNVTIALAGDTMLGRGVAAALEKAPPESLFAPEVAATVREADLALVNLECCIATRGERWQDPAKPFFFRAPPAAVEALLFLGIDCVTLANNHALDFGYAALADTLDLLHGAGIATVGAGADVEEARRLVVLEAGDFRLGVVGVTDHPAEYAAGPRRPGVAFARLDRGIPGWLAETISGLDADAVVVTAHWGPNMVEEPLPEIRAAAAQLLEAGATVIAGHSAHVFHGVGGPVLYDLGDFVDDYATDPVVRNDLGLLFLLTLDREGPVRLEALPLKLEYCHTRLAEGDEAAWIVRRFRSACAALGTTVGEEAGRLIIDWRRRDGEPRRRQAPRAVS
jgi:poly-gamma-glutamate synthesis protein (capsule biosynthesis protein)